MTELLCTHPSFSPLSRPSASSGSSRGKVADKLLAGEICIRARRERRHVEARGQRRRVDIVRDVDSAGVAAAAARPRSDARQAGAQGRGDASLRRPSAERAPGDAASSARVDEPDRVGSASERSGEPVRVRYDVGRGWRCGVVHRAFGRRGSAGVARGRKRAARQLARGEAGAERAEHGGVGAGGADAEAAACAQPDADGASVAAVDVVRGGQCQWQRSTTTHGLAYAFAG